MNGLSAVFGLLAVLCATGAQAAPRVVASIKPLQSLAAGVMDGIATPDVLIKGSASVHAYALRPSDADLLNTADVVFWVDPAFESFLEKPLRALGGNARIVSLKDSPNLKVLPARNGGLWRGNDGHDAGGQDGHLWLDPDNAKVMVAMMAEVLSAADASNAARYRANAVVMYAKLDALDAELRARLAPVALRPFIVFHDAYQYFENSYSLNAVGSITVSADRAPGARRVLSLKQRVGSDSLCVFAEPQFEPKLVRMLIGETHARTGVLDPEGSLLAPGPDLYFVLMRDLAESLSGCLASNP